MGKRPSRPTGSLLEAGPGEKRAAAAQATLDKFKDRPFEFGKRDCAQLVKFHLRQLGCPIRCAKAGSYNSLLGARRALKRLGHADLLELMDASFARVPPAAALIGDLIAMPGEGELGALTVYVGNGRVLGYHQDALGATVLQPSEYVAAWRMPV